MNQEEESLRLIEQELYSSLEKYKQLAIKRFYNLLSNPNFSTSQKEQKALQKLIQNLEQQILKLKEGGQGDGDLFQTNDISDIQLRNVSITRQDKQGRDEMRRNNIIDIFFFYCKLFYKQGPHNDFGAMSYDTQVMSLGKFLVFCRQFSILDSRVHPIEKDEQFILQLKNKNKQVVKKKDEGHKWWIGQEYQQQRQNLIEKLQKEEERIYNQLSRHELTNIFRKYSNNFKEVNFWEFEKLLPKIACQMIKDNNKNQEKCYEWFMKDILHLDKKEYKKHLHVLNTAFYCYEQKGFRQLPGYESYLYKKPEVDESKKEVVSQWQLLKQSQLHNRLLDQSSNNNNKSKIQLSSQLLEKSQGIRKPQQSNYRQIGERKIQSLSQNQSKGLTWEKLESLGYKDILEKNDHTFKPQDLVEDFFDKEDQFYLRNYNLKKDKEDKQKNTQRSQNLKIQQAQYCEVDSQNQRLKLLPTPSFPKSAISSQIQRTQKSTLKLTANNSLSEYQVNKIPKSINQQDDLPQKYGKYLQMNIYKGQQGSQERLFFNKEYLPSNNESIVYKEINRMKQQRYQSVNHY